VTVSITSPARTVADCFKYRNKIGLDVALEALREYRPQFVAPWTICFQAAQDVRVARVLRPYLEALTNVTAGKVRNVGASVLSDMGNPERVPMPSHDGAPPAKPAGSPRD